MKPATVFVQLCMSSLAAASIFGSQTSFEPTAIEVPGDNPLKHCDAGGVEQDILTIKKVDLTPNPPAA